MKAILILLAACAMSLFVAHQAGPNDVGFWGWIFLFLEDTHILAFVRETCLLVAGTIVFDLLYLPEVDTWRLIRHGEVGKGSESVKLPEERVTATLGFQRVVLGCYIVGLALILYT